MDVKEGRITAGKSLACKSQNLPFGGQAVSPFNLRGWLGWRRSSFEFNK